ncbi:MAG: type I 3-dehydroquinate dehydratase [Thermoanaerobaculia bacterium]|nr:type I 3-dehydroquinate dehydratase [Thermoanaerobaculia bacterium]
MKLFVTILEKNSEAALAAIRAIDGEHDGVEVRAEHFGEFDPAVFRAATGKTIIMTFRGASPSRALQRRVLDAGIELVDVEYPGEIEDASRTVLSLHDFEGMPDLDALVPAMLARNCAHAKIAVTPRNFADNRRLLSFVHEPRITLIGMGERGIYSRILAPFLGSELVFVAPSEDKAAAPGQISLQRALDMECGGHAAAPQKPKVFAVVGNPASHSVSPSIHNPLFRQKNVPAAYTIASIESFDEITEHFLNGEPCGLSVTAPFKEVALAFAKRVNAEIGENAIEAGAVNTLVKLEKTILADNTDVDGFNFILSQLCGRDRKSVALIGAGGTARAALVSLQRAGMHVTLFNRTEENARKIWDRTEPLERLASFDGEIIINTTAAGDVQFSPRAGMAYVEAAYGGAEIAARHERLRAAGIQVFDGLELLRAQAVRQHELFMKVFDESR